MCNCTVNHTFNVISITREAVFPENAVYGGDRLPIRNGGDYLRHILDDAGLKTAPDTNLVGPEILAHPSVLTVTVAGTGVVAMCHPESNVPEVAKQLLEISCAHHRRNGVS